MGEDFVDRRDDSRGIDNTEHGPVKASAWPPFVALGLMLGEVGVVLNVFPLAVGGILLFGGSVAGILTDAAFTETPWSSMAILGSVFAVIGAAIWTNELSMITAEALLTVDTPTGIAVRGVAILLGGVLMVALAVGGIVFEPLDELA